MEDLKISFRFGDVGFSKVSELNEIQREKVTNYFQLWEKRVRHCSAVHSLNKELNLDSSKIVNVSVETKKESQTVIG